MLKLLVATDTVGKGTFARVIPVGDEADGVTEFFPDGMTKGLALCGPEDRFDRGVGEQLAIARALRAFADRLERQAYGTLKHRADERERRAAKKRHPSAVCDCVAPIAAETTPAGNVVKTCACCENAYTDPRETCLEAERRSGRKPPITKFFDHLHKPVPEHGHEQDERQLVQPCGIEGCPLETAEKIAALYA